MWGWPSAELAGGMCGQVFPKDSGLKCTFTAWKPVCEYILNQMTVSPTSPWRTNGLCMALKQ